MTRPSIRQQPGGQKYGRIALETSKQNQPVITSSILSPVNAPQERSGTVSQMEIDTSFPVGKRLTRPHSTEALRENCHFPSATVYMWRIVRIFPISRSQHAECFSVSKRQVLRFLLERNSASSRESGLDGRVCRLAISYLQQPQGRFRERRMVDGKGRISPGSPSSREFLLQL